MKTTVDKRDLTEQLTLKTPWLCTLYDKPMLEMPMDKRFDYELRLVDGGVHLFRRDQDEGKIG